MLAGAGGCGGKGNTPPMGGAAGAKTTKYGPQRGPQGKPLGKKNKENRTKQGAARPAGGTTGTSVPGTGCAHPKATANEKTNDDRAGTSEVVLLSGAGAGPTSQALLP